MCGLQYIGETKQQLTVHHSVEYIHWANRANCMS
jgi:hypothetical protein